MLTRLFQSNDLRDLFTLAREGRAETTELFDDIRAQMQKAEESEKDTLDDKDKGKEKMPQDEPETSLDDEESMVIHSLLYRNQRVFF